MKIFGKTSHPIINKSYDIFDQKHVSQTPHSVFKLKTGHNIKSIGHEEMNNFSKGLRDELLFFEGYRPKQLSIFI